VTRTVLVTGANRGIGREVARQLAGAGDRVVVTARQGYGSRGAGGVIRPNETLVFVVDLVGVH
jgi:peptidylprolyl isomerase